MSRAHSKKKSGSAVYTIIIILLIGVIAFCGKQLYDQFQKYWKDYNSNLTVRELSHDGHGQLDWAKLTQENPDVRAWIWCKGTVIDYPVVQSHDDNEYLHTGFNGKYLVSGTIFLDKAVQSPFNEPKTLIYGHHMGDGSMFAGLDKWKQQSYMDDHPTMYIFTPDQNYKMTVLAVCSAPADDPLYTQPLPRENAADFVSRMYERAVCKSDAAADPAEDRYVMLSTCAYSYHNERTILIGKITPSNEGLKKYATHTKEPESKWKVFCRMVKEIAKDQFEKAKQWRLRRF